MRHLLSPDFMPHGYCYLWDPWIVWLHVVSDSLITLSYYCIPIVLVYFIRKQRDLPFNRIFWMFGVFILACGTTHLMEVWNIWHASYLLAGILKAVTATVSVLTALMLIPLVPKMVSLQGQVHLQEVNQRLQRKIAERQRLDEASADAPLRRNATIGIALAVFVIGLVGFLSWRNTRQAAADADWVSHTYEVESALQSTVKDAVDAETGACGFAITEREHLLEPYRAAQIAIGNDMGLLRRLTADNPNQQKQLDVLESQIRAGLEHTSGTIEIRRRTGALPEESRLEEGARLMDMDRAIVKRMQAEETQLLDQRTRNAVATRHLTSSTIIAGAWLGVGLMVLAGFAIRREIDVSAGVRAQIKALNTTLEQRVEQRTAALQVEIADRQRAEGALKDSLIASEQALKELADQKFALDQHAIVAITDVQGTITYVNDKFCAISQYSRDELMGKNHRILNSGHHPKEFFQEMYRTIAASRVWHAEIKNRAKDGSIYWVDTTIVPRVNAEGKPQQYVAIRADITERKKMEEVHGLLAALVESSDDAIISKTLNGVITAWNHGAEKVFGYSASEVVGKPMLVLFPPELVSEGPDILARIRRGEKVVHYETVRVRKDGARIDVSVTISPIRNAGGAIVGASKIARDITERKRAELTLQKQTEDLARSNRDLEQFAYAASHDLQEPLRAVVGCMQLLKARYEGKLDERGGEFLAHAVDGSTRMQRLIDDLLSFSRVGTREAELQEVSCGQVLQDAVKNLSVAITESQAQIEYDELPMVLGDLPQLALLFQNLIGNALKFHGSAAPRIYVSAERENAEWVISVRDNGIGIDPKYFERIFIIFQRLHTRKEYPGTGMGLALCKKIVERHGGKIWLDSKVGSGTTFRFTLKAPTPDWGG